MSVRDCILIGVEGTHASGKTTLVHALTAHYRSRGMLVDCIGEPARTSPFIEEYVIHGTGGFDLTTEADLFGAHLSATLRATRHQRLLICDKTIMNVVGYARMVLNAPHGTRDAAALDAMAAFCAAWASAYDAVFFLPDAYPDDSDPMRGKVTHLQDATTAAVRSARTDAGVRLLDVPAGLDLHERVAFLAARVDAMLAGAGV
ncbi:AAA family ATPase [Dactylosporangium matsuzakiense]|uniref:NadR/Ttd14 AAA domain-containing protein n=1 Tax=Dactylosporangium matsuzakiense TaxID=53360 RepID=A0A9W6KJ79_9ACTN|nr:AAA family ATPase [Dactylosporangium matsuzakiense]GLL02193.1 hypothetical protein GCM10017581_039350 [Dactylosporangium matsuzakiense]